MPSRLNDDATCLKCSKPVLLNFRSWSPGEGKVEVESLHKDESPECTVTLPWVEAESLAAEGRI